jgi:predicted flap endonuclease-1-like 5' DNA nuclease
MMSWYTVGEIIVWLLIAAVLGFVLGWLLRGLLRPRDAAPVVEPVENRAAAAAPANPTPASVAVARGRVAEIAGRTAGDGDLPNDDLVLIHGVGPKIAKLLVSMGITSFRQVARFTPDDIETVTEALEAFPGRIERDDWVGSARQLHREAYGTDPV